MKNNLISSKPENATNSKLNAMEETVQLMYNSSVVNISPVISQENNVLQTTLFGVQVVSVDNHIFNEEQLSKIKPIMKHLVSCLRVFEQPVTFVELSIERTASLRFWTISDESIEIFYALGIATGVLKNAEGTENNQLIKRKIEINKS